MMMMKVKISLRKIFLFVVLFVCLFGCIHHVANSGFVFIFQLFHFVIVFFSQRHHYLDENFFSKKNFKQTKQNKSENHPNLIYFWSDQLQQTKFHCFNLNAHFKICFGFCFVCSMMMTYMEQFSSGVGKLFANHF